MCPAPHAYHSDLTNNLSAALITRFDKTYQLQDLHTAIERHHDVLQDINTNDREEANQSINFATDLLKLAHQSAQITDLERAISHIHRVLTLLPVHHPNRLPMCNQSCFRTNNTIRAVGSSGGPI
jgi:hypothetical protein